ncbi:translation initiation factor Sui1 [Pseudomonas sp. EpS/L25]|uniref:translation initiation factor Sui1 n=1 Tax=Pseudomonas sp. EpS/L25 TaxID=1749078 RepID=UPI000743905A|nr:translation initiation factor Sui1 [Pseudomonas sp. EpS/L25]KUM39793.1 translation initiation factor EF-1 [Pseudomonas sp. EpS/L25]
MSKKTSSLSDLSRLVYSTDVGRIRPEEPAAPASTGDGIARVRRETKGRGGKTVTTVTGVPLEGDELRELASALKRRCGTGGAFKEGIIEIQGDHVDLLVGELEKRGFKTKRAGG